MATYHCKKQNNCHEINLITTHVYELFNLKNSSQLSCGGNEIFIATDSQIRFFDSIKSVNLPIGR